MFVYQFQFSDLFLNLCCRKQVVQKRQQPQQRLWNIPIYIFFTWMLYLKQYKILENIYEWWKNFLSRSILTDFAMKKTSLFDFQDKCVWVCVAVKRETVAATVAAAEEKLKSILFLQSVQIISYEKYRIYNKFVFRVTWWFVSTCSFVQLARAYIFIIAKSIIYTNFFLLVKMKTKQKAQEENNTYGTAYVARFHLNVPSFRTLCETYFRLSDGLFILWKNKKEKRSRKIHMFIHLKPFQVFFFN